MQHVLHSIWYLEHDAGDDHSQLEQQEVGGRVERRQVDEGEHVVHGVEHRRHQVVEQGCDGSSEVRPGTLTCCRHRRGTR